MWIGFIFILVGIGFFLQQAGIWQFSNIFSSGWPIILIVIGIIQLSNRDNISLIPGILLIAIGGLLFVNKFVEFNVFKFSWPIILIIVGLVFIFSRSTLKATRPSNSDELLESFSLFSATNIESNSAHFQGGTVTTIFGGAEIDLRDATFPNEGATLELTTIFGGIELRVPENVNIQFSGTPIFGGLENKTRKHVGQSIDIPVLTIHCTAIFGGIEVKD